MKRFFSTLLIASLLVCAMLLASCELFPEKPPVTTPDHVCEFKTEVIEPTCTHKGYTLNTCEECG